MNYMTVTEYAKLKGVSRQYVRWLAKKGKIKAEKLGKAWVINKDQEA